MNSLLDQIKELKQKENRLNPRFSLNDISEGLYRKPCDFVGALKRKRHQPRVIAEIKFRSPSEGVLNSESLLEEIANSYVDNGALALSILTEEHYFMGSVKYIQRVRKLLPNIPILMKDFIYYKEQLVMARLVGADAVLLIAKILSERQLNDLYHTSLLLGLTPIIEINNESELSRSLRISPEVLLVNNRDLRTLEVDMGASHRLSKKIPNNIISICASGVSSGAQINEFQSIGYDSFLIGSALMKSDDPGLKLKKLLNEVEYEN